MRSNLILCSLLLLSTSAVEAAPSALLGTVINTGLTGGLNVATQESFGTRRVRTVRQNYRVSYVGSANYASNRRLRGVLRSYRSMKGDIVVSNSLYFTGDIFIAKDDRNFNISDAEEARSSALRFEFPANDSGVAASCEAKPIRVRTDNRRGTIRITYALDVRMKRSTAGNEVVRSRRGLCQGLVAGDLTNLVPNLPRGTAVPGTLLVNDDSQFEVLVPKPAK